MLQVKRLQRLVVVVGAAAGRVLQTAGGKVLQATTITLGGSLQTTTVTPGRIQRLQATTATITLRQVEEAPTGAHKVTAGVVGRRRHYSRILRIFVVIDSLYLFAECVPSVAIEGQR